MRLLKILSAIPLLATNFQVIAQERAISALPHALVYKTTKDYSRNVSIQLTDDKKSVASYPAPTDVRPELMPVKLRKGYLLSRSGISTNTVYLNISIDAYSQLKKAPLVDEMYKMIKDKNPFTEIWDCGILNDVTEKQLNSIIDKKQLKTKCKRVR